MNEKKIVSTFIYFFQLVPELYEWIENLVESIEYSVGDKQNAHVK